MDLAVFSEAELTPALRALKQVALANGSVTPAETELLDTLARLHGRADAAVSALTPIERDELAASVTGAHARKRLVQLAVVTAMCDGEVTRAQDEAVHEIAGALDIDEKSLRVVHDVAGTHLLLARIDFLRRAAPVMMGDIWEDAGVKGILKLVRSIRGGVSEPPETAWRYKQLGLLPAGTVGRLFWEHCTRRRFTFPGEPGGIPEALVHHDFGHVLAGYDTDPLGEIGQGAFQAGNRREDGFAFLLFVLTQFHLGVKLHPIVKPEKGLFAPARILEAVRRGAACRVDLTDHWDHWAVVERPIDEVRAELGIPPLTA